MASVTTDRYKAVAYISYDLKGEVDRYAQQEGLSFSKAVEKLLTYYATHQPIAVTLTPNQKKQLETIGAQNHRTMEGQAAAILAAWLESNVPEKNIEA